MNEAVEASPALRQLIRLYVEALLAQTFQTVACNTVHSVEARCCRWILSAHDRVDQDTLPLTHEFLAQTLGVHRSTVSIVARTLQRAGLITQSRGVITVADRAGLEEAACECYGIIRGHFSRLLPGTYVPKHEGTAAIPLQLQNPNRLGTLSMHTTSPKLVQRHSSAGPRTSSASGL